MNKEVQLAIIAVAMLVIGWLAVIFDVTTSASDYRLVNVSASGQFGTEGETIETRPETCDDYPTLMRRIICRTVTWGNPVWLAAKVTNTGDALSTITNAIGAFFNLLFQAAGSYFQLLAFSASGANGMITTLILYALNAYAGYLIYSLVRGTS